MWNCTVTNNLALLWTFAHGLATGWSACDTWEMTHEQLDLRRRRRLCQGALRPDRRGDAARHRLGFYAVRCRLRRRACVQGRLLPACRPSRSFRALDGEAPDPAAGRPRRDRGDPASLRGADRPFGRLCRDGGLARTAARCGITPAGRLRKPPDRLCAALDRCRSEGRAGARSPCLGRLDAARARRLGRSHGQELSVERSDLRPAWRRTTPISIRRCCATRRVS